jgi:hypothetical protein
MTMRLRALLGGAVLLLMVRCADDEPPSGDDASGAGDGGESTSGGASGAGQGGSGGSDQGGSGGSVRGGTSNAGEAGEASGGSSAGAGAGQGGADAGRGGGAGENMGGEAGGGDGSGTISGQVTLFSGSPVEGAVVAIGSATTNTDANGRFEVPNVPAEYDLVLIVEAESFARVVHGLTTRTPRLTSIAEPPRRSAVVMGVVTGGAGVPVPADRDARAAYYGPNFATSGSVPLRDADASYALQGTWYGPTSVSGSLYALEARVDGMGRPLSYDGFGATPFALSDTGTFGMRDGSTPATTIELEPVSSRAVTGTLSVPSGYDPVLWFNLGPFLTDYVDIAPGSYSSVVPLGITDLPTNVQVHAERTLTAGTEVSETTFMIRDSTTALNLSTPAAAAPIVPIADAVEVDYDTVFMWNSPIDSVSTLTLDLGTWFVQVTTTESRTSIPDLTTYGIGHPPGGAGNWYVSSDLGPTTTDEWIEVTPDPRDFLAEHGRVGWAFSLERSFTLAN